MPLVLRVKQQIRKNLDRFYSSKVSFWNGFTGDHSGTVLISGKPGYIYVRDWNGIVHKVFNNVVRTDVANIGVKCGYDPFTPGLQRVLGVSNVSISSGDETPPLVSAHHEQHEWPNYDIVWVQGQQFIPALVASLGGMTIAIWPHYMRTGSNTFIAIQQTEVDLTPYVPVSGACWALISTKEDGTIDVDTSTTAASRYALFRTPILAPADPSYRPLAAVALTSSTTAIAQNKNRNDIVDLRWTLGSQGTVLTNDYDLNDNGVVDESESTWALRGTPIDPLISPALDEHLVWDGSQWISASPPTYLLAMQDGVSNPPVPVETEDGTDWLLMD